MSWIGVVCWNVQSTYFSLVSFRIYFIFCIEKNLQSTKMFRLWWNRVFYFFVSFNQITYTSSEQKKNFNSFRFFLFQHKYNKKKYLVERMSSLHSCAAYKIMIDCTFMLWSRIQREKKKMKKVSTFISARQTIPDLKWIFRFYFNILFEHYFNTFFS